MMNNLKGVIATGLAVVLCLNTKSFAQQNSVSTSNLDGQEESINTITTSVPFLIIGPDSRGGAMGDAGVSTSPDAYSTHWNASKLAFAEKDMSFSVSFVPWLKQLVDDINLSYLTGYKKIGKDQAIGGSLRYFSLGNITFTDFTGNTIQTFKPNEYAVDLSYARKLSQNFSGGITLRYINSNLTGQLNTSGAESKPGRAVAADVSVYYQKPDLDLGDKKGTFAFGTNISNIGNKISYSSTGQKDFIPINLRLGPRLTIDLDNYNQVTFVTDFNKLLVPTPPIYALDAKGNILIGPDGQKMIAEGQDPNRPVASGIFGSFTDAPGGFKEELREVNTSLGMEYWYDKLFAFRAGYFYEHPTKGNRQFFTVGAGLRYNVFGLDLSYLVSTQRNNPLQNTLRFSLTFDFDAFSSQNKTE